MVLDKCAKFCLEHNWWFYLYPIPSKILQEQNSHFSAFCSLLFKFSWGLHACTLAINSAGSVSKTSNTWWQYRYLPQTCKYRQYRYLVSCPSLPACCLQAVTSLPCEQSWYWLVKLRQDVNKLVPTAARFKLTCGKSSKSLESTSRNLVSTCRLPLKGICQNIFILAYW